MANSPLIRPYLLGGSFGGGTLDYHDAYLINALCTDLVYHPLHGNNLSSQA